MNNIEQLYSDIIMQHSMHSPHKKDLPEATCTSLGHNPSCGDKITLQVIIEKSIIKDIAFSGSGCAISQSSTSIMSDLLIGKSTKEAKKLITIFIKMIQREKISSKEKEMLQNARIYEGVANMPSRAKCATLSWHTLQDILNQL